MTQDDASTVADCAIDFRQKLRRAATECAMKPVLPKIHSQVRADPFTLVRSKRVRLWVAASAPERVNHANQRDVGFQ